MIERFFDHHQLDTPPVVTNMYGRRPSAAGTLRDRPGEKQQKYKAGTIG
jgi:hypothetical protein